MDNVLNKILCILSCAILLIGIFISSFFLTPVFADSSMPEIPVFVASTSTDVIQNGIFIGTGNSSYFISVNVPNVYLFFVKKENSTTNYRAYAISNDNFTYYYSTGSLTTTSANLDSTNNIYYQVFPSASNYLYLTTTNTDIPVYSSYEEGISNIPSSSFYPLYDGFNIPRGYLAWIEWNFIPDSLVLSTTFPNNSDFWNSGYPFNTQWFEYYHGSSVITIPTVLSNGGSKIPWVKGGNPNIWGQSKEANATLSSITGSVDAPSFICNPVYQSGSNRLSSLFNSNELPPMNGSITISDPEGSIKKIRLYSLTSAYNSDTDTIDNTLSLDTPSYSVDIDENGVVSYQPLNSTAPAVSIPVENGGTYVDPSDYSTSDIISTINNAFSTLISRIEAIFHPAAGYFQSLLNSFNDFVHWLSNLWVWLPAPIVTLIEAVLYISISVGLIKLVLK